MYQYSSLLSHIQSRNTYVSTHLQSAVLLPLLSFISAQSAAQPVCKYDEAETAPEAISTTKLLHASNAIAGEANTRSQKHRNRSNNQENDSTKMSSKSPSGTVDGIACVPLRKKQ